MHRFVLAGWLPVFLAVSGLAQEPPLVTEDELLATLDAAHPALAESAEALALARARVLDAASLENPLLGVVREDPSGPVTQTDWTLSWQLPGASRRPTIAARQQAVEAATARLAEELLALRSTARSLYATWAVAAERQKSLQSQAARLEALTARETERAKRGEASGLEAQRLSLAAAGLRAQVALAATVAEDSRAKVRSLFPSLPVDAEPLLPPLPPAPELQEGSPQLRAAEAELAAATLEVVAAGRFVRSPELSVGWQRQEDGADAIDGPTVGVAWTLPLFTRNQAEKAASEARVAAARARLERVQRELDTGRNAARASFDRLATALADATTAVAGKERMLAGAEAAFSHGEASLTDLLDTQRAVSEAELAVLELHTAALAVHRELERLAGFELTPSDLPNSTPQEDAP